MMRPETSTPRAWIVAAVTGVSALCWIVALLGLGRGIGSPGTDTSAPPPLPALPPASVSPMADAGSFEAVSTRSLFSEDRRPHPFRLVDEDGSTTSRLRLTGVLLAGDFGMATLTDEQDRSLRLRLNGDAVQGWQLLALEPRRATVLGPDGAQVLELAVFDGQGGQAPTVLGEPGTAMRLDVPPSDGRPQPRSAGGQSRNGGSGNPANATGATAAPPAPGNGPSEEQMNAIRERIRARRAQLQQQQQQQQQSGSPAGGAANR